MCSSIFGLNLKNQRLVNKQRWTTLTILLTSCLFSGCNSGKSLPNDSKVQTEIRQTSQEKITKMTSLEEMKIAVTKQENRPYSYTNKRSAFYYGQTHINDHPEHTWFSGLNIAKKRIFADYQIQHNQTPLKNELAEVVVYPHKLVRTFPSGITETMRLFDNQDIVKITVSGAQSGLSLNLLGEQVTSVPANGQSEITFYSTSEDPSKIIGIAPITKDTTLGQLGFYILVADSQKEVAQALTQVRENDAVWAHEREVRMLTLVNKLSFTRSNDARFDLAMQWITLNMDQLMTQQRGFGIYAGVPWFNEYWGRDSFIALPGASLVTGQYEWARKIITSFAQFQDTNPNSRFFGRVPNIVKPDELNYHTTDGTPRFIIQMQEYVRYSGDQSLIEEMFPYVENSIEGALINWVDDRGYLLHEDNETWMDARRAHDKMPYSPRGSRANDIQALWHQQLLAGVYFAQFVGKTQLANKWQTIANQVQQNFEQDFITPEKNYLADRLNKQDKVDMALRPNQLYAFDLIKDTNFKASATRQVWQHLVYPWGVASLDNRHAFFHPYHLSWNKDFKNPIYHKDQAYHNGTVWLWNNGMAMQRMIEVGQTDMAFKLFSNMNMFALQRGVVGGLAENSDAYPKAENQWPTLTGTYLQAWSNSEHLRVWYQYFLGIRPDQINQTITLAPRIPSQLLSLDYQSVIGSGNVIGTYRQDKKNIHHHYKFDDISGIANIDIEGFEIQNIPFKHNEKIDVIINHASKQPKMTIYITDATDKQTHLKEVVESIERVEQLKQWNQIMQGVQFASPLPLTHHAVLQEATIVK